MRKAYVLEAALVLALTGCTTIPSPTEALAEGNAQVRLTEAAGNVEGGVRLVGGSVDGKSCILTVMGQIPAADIAMTQGGCSVSVGGP